MQGARAFVKERLATWGAPEALVRDAVLLVSELASNAILHGRPPIELRLRQTAEHVLVEVDDGATVLPRKLRPTPDDEHGRGLVIAVAARRPLGHPAAARRQVGLVPLRAAALRGRRGPVSGVG